MGKQCPLCNSSEFTALLDKGLMRTVKELKVCCVHKDWGCPWEGKYGKLEQHLAPKGFDDQSCQYVATECTYGCGERLQRRFLQHHQRKSCLLRPYICKYCEYSSIYEEVKHHHQPVCPNQPMSCPNQCQDTTVTRKTLESHLHKECPLQIVNCEFLYAGCKFKGPRQDMATHMSKKTEEHIEILSSVNRELIHNMKEKDNQIANLKSETLNLRKQLDHQRASLTSKMEALESRLDDMMAGRGGVCAKALVPQMPNVATFTLENFEHYRAEKLHWFSTPFYSHRPDGGYKMCIRVNPSGVCSGKGTHISVLVHLMKGEYDDSLSWPFRGSVTVEMLNQRVGGGPHYRVTIPFHDKVPQEVASQVRVGDMLLRGWGCFTYFPIADLLCKENGLTGSGSSSSNSNCTQPPPPTTGAEYLVNNCVQFAVHVDAKPSRRASN